MLRRIGALLVWLLILVLLLPVVVPPFLDRIYYRGPVSAHFDGAHFHNPDGDLQRQISAGTFARFWAMKRGPWPDHVALTPVTVPPRIDGGAMRATWIGHSTVLVQTQGLNILTDPIWAERAGPFGLFGPQRVRAPAIRLEDLPKIDLILVSHNHYDHMDLATLKRLWDRDKPVIVTSLGNDTVMRGAGIESVARDWGGRVALRPGIDVIVERVHHWGSRWGTDRNRALWSGFTVTLPGGNLFFAGDTGYGDGSWPVEAARDGPYRFAILPIGAFEPREMMGPSHVGPVESVEIFRRMGAAYAVGVHWGTFRLSAEAFDDPPRLVAATAAKYGLGDRFVTLAPGRSWSVPASSQPRLGSSPH